MVKDIFVCYLVQSEEIFQIIPEWTQLSQGQKKKKAKKPCNIDQKNFMKILLHFPLTFSFD